MALHWLLCKSWNIPLKPLWRQCTVPNDTTWLLDISHPTLKGLFLYNTSIFHNSVSLRIATGHYELFLWELFPWVEYDGSWLVAGNQVWMRPCAQVLILHEAAWVMDWLNRIWSQWISLNRWPLNDNTPSTHIGLAWSLTIIRKLTLAALKFWWDT